MPVRVTLENTGADLDGRIEALVADGLNQLRYAQSVALPAVSRKEVTLFARIPGGANLVTVSFLSDNKVITQEVKNISCLQTTSNLLGVWASTPSVYNIFTTLSFSGGRTSVAVLEQADYAIHPEGLQMLDMMVISDVDTGALSEAQRRALVSWVTDGGRLIVTGGPGWQKTVAGLEALLPIQATGATTVLNLSGLEWFSPESEALTGDTIVTTGNLLPTARVLASQENTPLILQHRVGFGDVSFMAADPALAPLRNWTGIEQLYQNLFAIPLDIPSWANGFTSWYEASSAVSNVPGLGLPSIFLICGFLGLYVLALGPINYLVLRQLKRRELAWISIPILVIVFSFAAFILGLIARGTRPIINHLAIVQVWPDREQASVMGLVGVFSPNRSEYTIETEGDFLAHPIPAGNLGAASSWQFLQNEGGATAEDVRIDVGGIEGVAVSGHVPAPDFPYSLTMDLTGNRLLIQGQITNSSQLALRDVVVVGPGQVQQLGDFRPGDRGNINLTFPFSGGAVVGNNLNPFPSTSYDTTLTDFFGTSYIYNSVDQDLARRFNLLQATLGYGGGRGGGIYLLGWTDSSPLTVNLDGKGFRAEHTAIYIVALNPSYQMDKTSTITLPPALFTWSSLTNTSYSEASPYNAYLYQGTYSYRFQLNQAISYKKVNALTFNLTSYGSTGSTSLLVSLWDFTKNDWEQLTIDTWGEHNIVEPERFVGYGGDIRLQIENPFQTSVEIERSDFTLVVEQ